MVGNTKISFLAFKVQAVSSKMTELQKQKPQDLGARFSILVKITSHHGGLL